MRGGGTEQEIISSILSEVLEFQVSCSQIRRKITSGNKRFKAGVEVSDGSRPRLSEILNLKWEPLPQPHRGLLQSSTETLGTRLSLADRVRACAGSLSRASPGSTPCGAESRNNFRKEIRDNQSGALGISPARSWLILSDSVGGPHRRKSRGSAGRPSLRTSKCKWGAVVRPESSWRGLELGDQALLGPLAVRSASPHSHSWPIWESVTTACRRWASESDGKSAAKNGTKRGTRRH